MVRQLLRRIHTTGLMEGRGERHRNSFFLAAYTSTTVPALSLLWFEFSGTRGGSDIIKEEHTDRQRSL